MIDIQGLQFSTTALEEEKIRPVNQFQEYTCQFQQQTSRVNSRYQLCCDDYVYCFILCVQTNANMSQSMCSIIKHAPAYLATITLIIKLSTENLHCFLNHNFVCGNKYTYGVFISELMLLFMKP